ncbi:MAG TPA: phenylalanine--tRNA ligase beta subunit-related protein [Anaerolineae bacterium]|nr:phenylalanine--tRNA ligase beta subunit-related protein [Anaerolineae bacterium]
MLRFLVSETWRAAYPGAAAGILAMRHVANPDHAAALDARKDELEQRLRSQFAGHDRAALKALAPNQAYQAYFKRFGKTYHVLLQLESVVLKGKPIPRASALVEAMFMAELKNLLLTAGHDLESLQAPVRLDVANGGERYAMLNQREQALAPGDMLMVDAQGVISSVIYGPDYRTRIKPDTRHVLFAVYAPSGIEEQAVYSHLQDIQANVLLVAPEAETQSLQVYRAE